LPLLCFSRENSSCSCRLHLPILRTSDRHSSVAVLLFAVLPVPKAQEAAATAVSAAAAQSGCSSELQMRERRECAGRDQAVQGRRDAAGVGAHVRRVVVCWCAFSVLDAHFRRPAKQTRERAEQPAASTHQLMPSPSVPRACVQRRTRLLWRANSGRVRTEGVVFLCEKVSNNRKRSSKAAACHSELLSCKCRRSRGASWSALTSPRSRQRLNTSEKKKNKCCEHSLRCASNVLMCAVWLTRVVRFGFCSVTEGVVIVSRG
jgi:hypothetical protein